MAINIAHRNDLDARVEALALRLGLNGKGRKTRIIERALSALEAEVENKQPSQEEIEAEFRRIREESKDFRRRMIEAYPGHDPENLSLTCQDELYDDRGLPR